ncbi:MAG: NAD(P)/FAD-dependent oxidoreductase [Acidobacteriota bacterium]
MRDTAQVVIIGGGIVGHAIAYNLAHRGCRDVVVVEKEPRIGSGSTAYSAGGVREQFTSAVNIQMARASLDILEHFEEVMGQAIDYKRAGYLFLATTAAQADALRDNVACQNELGVTSQLVSPAEARERIPALNIEDVVIGAFNDRDGYVDPSSICLGYNARARDLGVRVRTRARVTAIDTAGEKVTGVRLENGDRIDCSWVVNAAGPSLHEVGKLAGLDVPAHPYRRMLFITEKFSLAPRRIPLVVDMASGFYFREEGEGIMMGLANPDEPSSFDTTLDWDYLPRVLEPALHRIPSIEAARIGKGWAGLYSITPDHHALLGAYPRRPNLVIAGGFSGHGIMHSPAAGVALAELILDGAADSIDITPLSPTRMTEGRLLTEHNVI